MPGSAGRAWPQHAPGAPSPAGATGDPVAGLAAGLAALRTALALTRDPLAGPDVLLGHAFRALPRPRSTGPAAGRPAGGGRRTATAPGVGRQPGVAEQEEPASHLRPVGPPAEPPGGESETEDRAPDQGSSRSVAGAASTEDLDEEVVELVGRAQSGDAEAFGELYDRYVDLVYRYVYYRVGGQALAEDLTSEVFLRALRRITSFTWQGRDIGAWFVTIARNLVADHFKSGRYRLEVATADMLDADRAEEGPERAVLASITNVTLLEAVKQLGPEQQECIVLRFLQGLSVAETALAMGKNEGAIKALQYRAVRALGRLLPEDLL